MELIIFEIRVSGTKFGAAFSRNFRKLCHFGKPRTELARSYLEHKKCADMMIEPTFTSHGSNVKLTKLLRKKGVKPDKLWESDKEIKTTKLVENL